MDQVVVEKNREIQFYSCHSFGLKSELSNERKCKNVSCRGRYISANPGGAPKHKALQLIDRYETTRRNCMVELLATWTLRKF